VQGECYHCVRASVNTLHLEPEPEYVVAVVAEVVAVAATLQ